MSALAALFSGAAIGGVFGVMLGAMAVTAGMRRMPRGPAVTTTASTPAEWRAAWATERSGGTREQRP